MFLYKKKSAWQEEKWERQRAKVIRKITGLPVTKRASVVKPAPVVMPAEKGTATKLTAEALRLYRETRASIYCGAEYSSQEYKKLFILGLRVPDPCFMSYLLNSGRVALTLADLVLAEESIKLKNTEGASLIAQWLLETAFKENDLVSFKEIVKNYKEYINLYVEDKKSRTYLDRALEAGNQDFIVLLVQIENEAIMEKEFKKIMVAEQLLLYKQFHQKENKPIPQSEEGADSKEKMKLNH